MNTKINYSHFENFPVLESERLLYRRPLKSDAKDFLAIRSDNEVMRYMDSKKLESMQEAENFISLIDDNYNNKIGITWVIIEKFSNTAIGYFGYLKIKHEHCRAEIGYALKQTAWGKGFMTETVKVMLNFGFKGLKLHSIEANVNPNNEKSIKLLQKAGFKKEAYFKEDYFFNGVYFDSQIFSLLETDI